jgi:uncharacterized protein YndB with AHSA1/START domain
MAATKQARSASGPAEQVLSIERTFEAPRELVWKVWSDPSHFVHWMGPRDYPMVQQEGEFRPGGRWRGCLRSIKTGEDMWQSGVYQEIVEPERIVFTFAWDRPDGSRSPETVITVTFAEHRGKTVMTFTQTGFDSVDQLEGHRGGWNSSFDRLADYLKAVSEASRRK